jgi:hypothetical protein
MRPTRRDAAPSLRPLNRPTSVGVTAVRHPQAACREALLVHLAADLTPEQLRRAAAVADEDLLELHRWATRWP